MNITNVRIRPLLDSDATTLAELGNNRKIWNNIRDAMPHPYFVEHATYFINSKKDELPKCTFAITIDDQLCGVIGLEPKQDVYRTSAELGYWLGEPYWGNGIVTEAVRQVTEYGFQTLGLHRIFAAAFEYNLASMRILEKNGFVKEGVARKSVLKNGEYIDEHQFGKLNGE